MTIKALHNKLMIEALQDDPRVNYAKRIVVCELLAQEMGWEANCTEEYLAMRLNSYGLLEA